MAAPANVTLKTLTGSWTMNKALSDSAEPVLSLQGVGYIVRKGIDLATINLDVNVYEAPPTPPNTSTDIYTHIDIDQTASRLSSTHEKRCLDDHFRPHSDWLFGDVEGKTRWIALDEVEDAHLKSNWLPVEDEAKPYLLSYVKSVNNGWVAQQVWGFQTINGERRYCRNILVTKGEKKVTIRLVYDYNSN